MRRRPGAELRSSKLGSVLALLVTALVSGAVAGLVAAAFIWLVETLTELIWVDLPEQIGVDPFESWWLFAVPIAGGVLVGLGQRFLGNMPEPIDRNVARWRAGGHIDPATLPATGINSLSALVTGGPIGFEAALTGLIGGIATWIGGQIRVVGHLVRQAWGAERIDALPHPTSHLPYWLAAVGGLMAYRWLPFGQIDLSFRFGQFDGEIGVVDTLAVFVFAALVVVPAAWAARVVSRVESATLFRRSPILVAVAGGVVFALLAVPSEFVLFSGQEGIQQLGGIGTGELLYLAVAKWLALVIALLAGWRGGPIFPLFFAVAAIAVAVDGALDVEADVMMIGGIAAVSVMLLRGNIPIAFVLTLYVVPLSYAAVILVGSLGAATALAIERSVRASGGATRPESGGTPLNPE